LVDGEELQIKYKNTVGKKETRGHLLGKKG